MIKTLQLLSGFALCAPVAQTCASCSAHWVYASGVPDGTANQVISCACDAVVPSQSAAGTCGGTLASGVVINKSVTGGQDAYTNLVCGKANGNVNECKSCSAHWHYDGGVFNGQSDQGLSCECD